MYKGEKVYIRKMVMEDAPFVLEWENEPENWLVSEGEGPYVLEDIIDLVNNIEDVQSSCQVRFIIFCASEQRPLGTIDLFNIDFNKRTAGVGILIAEHDDRRKGFGKESLSLVERAACTYGLDRLEALIHAHNVASLSLFNSSAYSPSTESDEQTETDLDKVKLEKWLRKY